MIAPKCERHPLCVKLFAVKLRFSHLLHNHHRAGASARLQGWTKEQLCGLLFRCPPADLQTITFYGAIRSPVAIFTLRSFCSLDTCGLVYRRGLNCSFNFKHVGFPLKPPWDPLAGFGSGFTSTKTLVLAQPHFSFSSLKKHQCVMTKKKSAATIHSCAEYPENSPHQQLGTKPPCRWRSPLGVPIQIYFAGLVSALTEAPGSALVTAGNTPRSEDTEPLEWTTQWSEGGTELISNSKHNACCWFLHVWGACVRFWRALHVTSLFSFAETCSVREGGARVLSIAAQRTFPRFNESALIGECFSRHRSCCFMMDDTSMEPPF